MRLLKWIAGIVGTVVAVAALVAGYQLYSFRQSADRVYVGRPLPMVASTDSAVIARGQHIAESFGGCAGCHKPGLGGGLVEDLGPIGMMRASNLTRGRGGVGDRYTDGELARAIRYGIGADGRSLLYMPTDDHGWLPDDDLLAVVSYVRSVPPVDNTVPRATVGTLGKLLNQFGFMPLLAVRPESLGASRAEVPAPAPTAAYGAYIARGCIGCHGTHLSGGRIPGAPASLPTPLNLTPDPTGLAGWTEEQFITLLNTGVRPDGRRLADFMPIAGTRALDDMEKRALWLYLQSLEPRKLGGR